MHFDYVRVRILCQNISLFGFRPIVIFFITFACTAHQFLVQHSYSTYINAVSCTVFNTQLKTIRHSVFNTMVTILSKIDFREQRLMTLPSLPCSNDSYHYAVLVLNSLLPCVVLALTFGTVAVNTSVFGLAQLFISWELQHNILTPSFFDGCYSCLTSASSLCSLLALNEI